MAKKNRKSLGKMVLTAKQMKQLDQEATTLRARGEDRKAEQIVQFQFKYMSRHEKKKIRQAFANLSNELDGLGKSLKQLNKVAYSDSGCASTDAVCASTDVDSILFRQEMVNGRRIFVHNDLAQVAPGVKNESENN